MKKYNTKLFRISVFLLSNGIIYVLLLYFGIRPFFYYPVENKFTFAPGQGIPMAWYGIFSSSLILSYLLSVLLDFFRQKLEIKSSRFAFILIVSSLLITIFSAVCAFIIEYSHWFHKVIK